MKRSSVRHLIASTFLVTFSSIILISCDKDDDAPPPSYFIQQSENMVMPAAVAVPANQPAGNTRVATYYAVGVQKYKSQLKAGTANTFEWVFVAPRADLYDISNNKVGTHTAGPTWQLSPADSIYAQHFVPAKTSPSPDANSIDWLLLTPKTGKAPTGLFTQVSYIQRIATKGGKAPLAAPTAADVIVEVPYTSVYRFTRINP